MFDAGSIVAKITLDSSQFTQSLNKARQGIAGAGESMQKFGQSIMSTSRQLSRVASTLTFIGAGITAPLMLAFKSAEKYSTKVKEEMDRLNNAFIGLRVSLAESLLPVMQKFTNVIANLIEKWNALSPVVRENILRTVFMTGIYFALAGSIASVILKLGTLIGFIIKSAGAFIAFASANPILLGILVLIGAITVAMAQMGDISTPVLNGIEKSILHLHNAWLLFRRSIAWVDMKSAIDTKDLEKAKAELDGINKALDTNRTRLQSIANTGKGQFAGAFDSLKNTIGEVKGLLSGLGENVNVKYWTEAPEAWSKGWSEEIQKTIADLNNWGKTARSIVQQTASSMQSIFSNFFQGFLKGEIRSAKQLFVEFGNFVLKILSDVIAQIITAKLMSGIIGAAGSFAGMFSGVGSGASATGSYTVGNVPVSGNLKGITAGFQEGTERIPYTGLYKLHAGEMITPRYDASKHEATKLTIYNMITSEAVAMAMQSKEGEGVIVNTINLNSLRNGVIRREVVKR